jgi:hypothetical protein
MRTRKYALICTVDPIDDGDWCIDGEFIVGEEAEIDAIFKELIDDCEFPYIAKVEVLKVAKQ